ncbi:hypothetical protein LCGC14_2007130 [marine sediment metagenome]|uniref:Uncharacterized protein n=1 Tax=marine sediment metagenome TaxID=412755 RepID=A0A0F9F1I1_9ZZZZ
MPKRKFQATKPKRKLITAEAIRKKTYRNYRRVWVHGYYRHVYILTYKNNKEVKVRVKRWIEPHWRKKFVKSQENEK